MYKRRGLIIEKTIDIGKLKDQIELFGNFDENIKTVEKELDVKIINRNNTLKIEGNNKKTEQALKVVDKMIKTVEKNDQLNNQKITYIISLIKEGMDDSISAIDNDCLSINSKGRPIKAKTIGQKNYIDCIKKNTITIGVGPAGTGKTFLAVAMAVNAFKNKDVEKIVLTRPAVEAGEKLGFLPGDLQDKVDPYLRPLYDALFQMMGGENFKRNLERGNLEVAPLAYMRGRTLDNSFLILDEAQNTTHEQMKMFLTRIGLGSKAVITGDLTQIDLIEKEKSGLLEATKILKGVEDISQVEFNQKDVVRHKIVKDIIKAYENYEKCEKG